MSNGHSLAEVSLQKAKSECHDALAAAGLPEELCEFYAETVKCERDMIHATFRMLRELRQQVEKEIPDTLSILNTIQTVSKKFNVWNQTLDELVRRHSSLPAVNLTLSRLNQFHAMPAKCSYQNNHVRNKNGQEGYVPAMTCVIPSPDFSAANAVDRLRLNLLTYWYDCDCKIESSLTSVVKNLLPTIEKLQDVTNGNNNIDKSSRGWKYHVSQLSQAAAEESDQRWTKIHSSLSELELELDSQKNFNLNSLTEVISNLDRAVVCFKGFRADRCQYQAKLQQAVNRPVVCQPVSKGAIRGGRLRRYYEIKLTALDTVVTEETVYVNNKNKPSQQTTNTSTVKNGNTNGRSIQDGGVYETTETEELTSVSHEENVKFTVKSVIDPRDGKEITMEKAVHDGIVNHTRGMYVNPLTGETCPLAVAMNDGRIRIERVVTSRSADQKKSIGLITICIQTETREYSISGAVDIARGVTLSADEARERGIIDEAAGYFLNTKTQEHMVLSDAVDAGHVIAEFDLDAASEPTSGTNGSSQCETKTFAVNGVVDQVERRPVPFNEAIRRGLIDRSTGCYINNVTGERVLASEAVKRGFFKCCPVDESASLADIDNASRVTVDRVQHVRKNVLSKMKVLSAFKQSVK